MVVTRRSPDDEGQIRKNLFEIFSSAFGRFEKRHSRGEADGFSEYYTAILEGVAYCAHRFGLKPTLGQFYALCHTLEELPLGVPAPLEMFVMEAESRWNWLQTLSNSQSLWRSLLWAQDLDEEIFDMWDPLRMRTLQRDVENIFLDSIEPYAALSTVPLPEEIADDLAKIPVALTRKIHFTLPAWEVKAIVEKRQGDILAMYQR